MYLSSFRTETQDDADETFCHQGAKFFHIYFILFILFLSALRTPEQPSVFSERKLEKSEICDSEPDATDQCLRFYTQMRRYMNLPI